MHAVRFRGCKKKKKKKKKTWQSEPQEAATPVFSGVKIPAVLHADPHRLNTEASAGKWAFSPWDVSYRTRLGNVLRVEGKALCSSPRPPTGEEASAAAAASSGCGLPLGLLCGCARQP